MREVALDYSTIIFDVTAEQVFDALTTPADIESFMVGTGPSSSWVAGDTVLWKSDAAGQFEDLGQVVTEVARGEVLEYTWHRIQPMHRPLFSSAAEYEVAVAETSTVRWTMESVEGDGLAGTRLTLRHFGFDSPQSVMLAGVTDGWVFFVSSLKTHLERAGA